MPSKETLLEWLREACSSYSFEPRGILGRSLREKWPLSAESYEKLEAALEKQGNLAALPRESAALANVIEVSVADFLQRAAAVSTGVTVVRGRERHYPDLELSGSAFGGSVYAVDIKVARRAPGGKRTVSRISLFTGNTYFRYPDMKWPLTLRSFAEYGAHVDLVALYDFDRSSLSGIRNLEFIAHESWRIASKTRSSTTREYIGAVDSVEALRNGKGEFANEEAFLKFWRKFDFKIGKAVQKQLDKFLAAQKAGKS